LRLLRRLAIAVAVPVVVLLLYAGAGFGLGAIPTGDPSPAGPIELAIVSNPFHTDLVLPAAEWREALGLPPEAQYIAIGWGARSFYAETPKLEDLKLSTVLKALSGSDPATIHVTWLRGQVLLGGDVHPLPVTAAQAAALAAYVRSWFDPAAPERIPGLAYGSDDMFFKARGHWTPFTTCNEWLAQGLRRAGIRTGLWAPFAPGITFHLPA
jgi:uncharacterized protein (TIGR02117 family)